MQAWKKLAALAAAAALVLGAAACGDDDGDEKDGGDETPAAGETFVPTAAPVEYPVTLTDMLGRSVTIEAAPQKVAALSPTAVELVYAVGGTSVTRSKSVNYPEAAKGAVDIGPSYQPNFELIAAQAPDLIIADSVLQAQFVSNFEQLGAPVLYVGAQTFTDVLAGLELVGQAIDHQSEGVEAAASLKNQLTVMASRLPGNVPNVLVLNGAPEDFYAAKPESYAGDLVRLLGVKNVAEGQPDVGRFPGYTKLSLESILASNPDVVLAITAGPPGGQTITDALSKDPAWAEVPAVKNGRVHEIDLQIFLQAPGPRASDGLDTLSKLLYPDIFGP